MNSNSFLSTFGIREEDFEETAIIKPEAEGNTDVLLVERRRDLFCASCGSKMHVHHKYVTTKAFRPHRLLSTRFIVERIVYRCPACRTCATRPLPGLGGKFESSDSERRLIREDLQSGMTFQEVADAHGITKARAIQLFDELFPTVAGAKLPRIMCVDEIRFDGSDDPYCCVIMDFETQLPVDIIRSRRKEWLDDYFRSFSPSELRRVEYVISDMFDGYARMRRLWMPKAAHIVDRFHVIQLMRNAVNAVRAKVMKSLDQESEEYRFMKANWESFLVRRRAIPDRWYGRKGVCQGTHYDEMVMRCLRLNADFLIAWGQFQDILSMRWGERAFEECLKDVDFNSKRLSDSSLQEIRKVGDSFRKWRVEIAKAMAMNDAGLKLTNGRMECMNNHLKTIVKKAYGYRNFDRFRRRCLLTMRYKKRHPSGCPVGKPTSV